jgi:hypothetical protein
MKTALLAMAAILWAGATPPAAEAQGCCHGHHGGCAKGGPTSAPTREAAAAAAPLYDPDTVTTLKGTATAVTMVPARGGRSGGIHVALQADGQTTDVHLGPAWFVKGEGVELASGDTLEVVGSILDADGKSYMVARELKKGSKVIKLRDERGVPVWSGRPRP